MLYVSVHPLACPPRWPQPDVGGLDESQLRGREKKAGSVHLSGAGRVFLARPLYVTRLDLQWSFLP
ncbi:uncharacterized protein TrAtP1_000528 [Trichoderma atroviride]|uniref:uncharacterized protein n=1 Tax=Hypocrea atroviridis TaxID=63577 RepID=UPI0033257422|nr:hypothetical protein TrAtP1_000528 [Trichoderma atroviride]